jgi:dTDP-4-dehydrorhamnose reductase
MKKTVLFTGGSGLLAINWALSIANDFEVVLGLHRRTISIPGIRTLMIDMESSDAFVMVLEKIRPDIVIHCAGLANVEACEADPAAAYHINVTLSLNVAGACKKQAVSFVYISTDHLFSGQQPLVTEDEIPAPVNEYGRTKLEAEKRILDISGNNLSIRTNFYGWGTSYRHSFSDMIIQHTRNNRMVSLFDDFYYTPILIEELSQTVMALIDQGASGIYNVAGKERISKYEFGIRLGDEFTLDKRLIKPTKFAERKDLVKRPADLSLSVQKVTAFLNRQVGDVYSNIERLKWQELNEPYALIKNI